MRGVATLVISSLLAAPAVSHAACPEKPKKDVKLHKEPITVPMPVLLAHAVSRVQPVYPPLAKTARIDGNVMVALEVDHEGAVTETRLLSGDPLLRPAAEAAVKQWRFDSFCIKGTPYTVRSVIEFQFRWRGSGAFPQQP